MAKGKMEENFSVLVLRKLFKKQPNCEAVFLNSSSSALKCVYAAVRCFWCAKFWTITNWYTNQSSRHLGSLLLSWMLPSTHFGRGQVKCGIAVSSGSWRNADSVCSGVYFLETPQTQQSFCSSTYDGVEFKEVVNVCLITAVWSCPARLHFNHFMDIKGFSSGLSLPVSAVQNSP